MVRDHAGSGMLQRTRRSNQRPHVSGSSGQTAFQQNCNVRSANQAGTCKAPASAIAARDSIISGVITAELACLRGKELQARAPARLLQLPRWRRCRGQPAEQRCFRYAGLMRRRPSPSACQERLRHCPAWGSRACGKTAQSYGLKTLAQGSWMQVLLLTAPPCHESGTWCS